MSGWFLSASAIVQYQHKIKLLKQKKKRTPRPKCDLSKFAKKLYWNHTLVWLFSYKFDAYFQNIFS